MKTLTGQDPLDRRIRQAFWLGTLCVSIPVGAFAHEGHAPLPTRGVQVDPAKGVLTLSPDAYRALAVRETEIENQAVERRIQGYAKVTTPWGRRAFATSRLSGRIAALHAFPGQQVKAGEVVAEVESVPLESLRMEILAAENELQLSEKLTKNLDPLAQSGAIAGQRFLELELKRRQQQNAMAIARMKWLNLGLEATAIPRLSEPAAPEAVLRLPVTSPIDGVVTHSDLSVGKAIEPSEHLFEILDLSTVWVEIGVLEKDLHLVRTGNVVDVTLTARPGEIVRGTIRGVGSLLDDETHLGTVWAEWKNDRQESHYVSGMSGQAQVIVSRSVGALTVPMSSLISDGVEQYVFVQQAATAQGYEFRKQNVIVGRKATQTVEIVGGDLFPGDRVMTTGSQELATLFVPGVLRVGPESSRNMGLLMESATQRNIEQVLPLDGAVDLPPERRAAVSSVLAGSLSRLLVSRGQSVRSGDTLAEIVSSEFQELQLDLIRTRLELDLLLETQERHRKASQEGGLSRRTFWETESRTVAVSREQEALQRKLLALGITADEIRGILRTKTAIRAFPVRATIDGVLVDFRASVGQALGANEPLFEIHDLSHAWIQGYVSERDIGAIRIGQTVRVRLTAYPAFLATGVVVRSGRSFGADSRTLSLWVELKTPPAEALQQNMMARLSVVLGSSEPVLAIPSQSIVTEGTRSFVFVQQPDGIFQRRLVSTGRSDDRFVEIRSGVKAGETLVISGAASLQTAYVSIR